MREINNTFTLQMQSLYSLCSIFFLIKLLMYKTNRTWSC